MPTPKAFALLGPTAGGKTALALKIAETLPVEIISLDSALVYTGMDIGTANRPPPNAPLSRTTLSTSLRLFRHTVPPVLSKTARAWSGKFPHAAGLPLLSAAQ